VQTVYNRPTLYPKQAQFVDDPSRFTYIEAGTKSGKTIACIIWLHEQTIKTKGKNEARWWIAPFYTTAKIAFTRWWEFIPDNIKTLFERNQSELSIRYPSGNKVYFKSAEKPDALYGEDVYDVVIDEASRMREESWNAIRSTLTATEGRAKIIGNVKGKKNWFYRYAQQQKQEPAGYYRLTSYDNPFISADEIDLARKNLPEKVFNELYLSEPSDDGSNPFGISHINANIYDLSNGVPVCYGVDLAKSVDYTVIIGIDNEGMVCYFDRFQKDWKQTTEIIGNVIKHTPTAIDSTGVGDPIVEDLQRNHYGVESFRFSSNSKQQIMEGLANAIQKNLIKYPKQVAEELECFEFQYTRTGVRYSAPDGFHDDIVCALALAWYKYSNESRTGTYFIR
jgi:hypothetical protein